MRYIVALDPTLALTAETVAAAWNADAATAAAGALHVEPAGGKQFDLASVGLTIITDLAVGMMGALLLQTVQTLVRERRPGPTAHADDDPTIDVQTRTLANGDTAIVIIQRKEQAP